MNLIKPKPLKRGDTIEIVAPAGKVDKSALLRARQYFEDKGYKVKFGKHVFDEFRYMAGADDARAEDIMSAFKNPETNAVLCARGGYGAIRILEKLDYDVIKNNPKIFCGYSDITALSLSIYKYAGLVTFSGPMAQSDFGGEFPDKYTEESFFNVLSDEKLSYMPEQIINNGYAEGIIWGGNLSTIVSLCGTNFIPDEKFIFFVEDVSEPAYKIDKMFTQLSNIEKFKRNIAAVAFGDFTGTDNLVWVDEIKREFTFKLGIPASDGFKFSHSKEKETIPIGVPARFDNGIYIK